MAASGLYGRRPSINTTVSIAFSPRSARRTSATRSSSPRPNRSAAPMAAICSWPAMAVSSLLHRATYATLLWCRVSSSPVYVIRAMTSRKPSSTCPCWKCRATNAASPSISPPWTLPPRVGCGMLINLRVTVTNGTMSMTCTALLSTAFPTVICVSSSGLPMPTVCGRTIRGRSSSMRILLFGSRGWDGASISSLAVP